MSYQETPESDPEPAIVLSVDQGNPLSPAVALKLRVFADPVDRIEADVLFYPDGATPLGTVRIADWPSRP